MGVIDVLLKLLSHDDLDVRRQVIRVYSSLFPNTKVQAKIRSTPECLSLIIKLLHVDDELSVINCCECITVLGADGIQLLLIIAANRSDFIKNGSVNDLLSIIEKPEHKIQSIGCLALARCLQDGNLL